MHRVTIVLDIEITDPATFIMHRMSVPDAVANALPQIDWAALGLTPEYVDHH